MRILTDTAMLVLVQPVSVRAAAEVGAKRVLTFSAFADPLYLHTLIDV